jgi:transcriptional regulator with XRE-family HTH domain
MDRQRIGEQIRAHRKRVNLHQADLAGKAQISESYLSLIERGQANISLEVLEHLSIALGTTPCALLGESEGKELVVPAALQQIAIEDGLAFDRVATLISLADWGRPPQTPDEWRRLYRRVLSAIVDERAAG